LDGSLTIRAAVPADAPRICEIYNHYVEETVVTFEESVISEGDMSRRIAATLETYPWLVAESSGSIAGYAYASRWRSRARALGRRGVLGIAVVEARWPNR
jgi:phosphinothricin acetyltransferase